MKPRVISYIRFSSQRQSRGRSEDRQNDAAREWCERNNLSLDENIQDLGVSAFTGQHRKKGNLAAFLDEVDAGKVPIGSYLLVEHFDRLTREEIDDADVLVKSILRKGVNIVTLLDGHVYTKKSLNNIGALISMILAFGQSHTESFKKGERVSDTFARKREEGKKPFGSAPGWLRRGPEGKEGQWEVVPELAEVVRKVFELAAAGMGGPSIARLANAENWPVPTRVTKLRPAHWHSKMPQILLKNRAVLGEAQHVIRGRNALQEMGSEVPVPAGPPIPDYYPRVIPDDLWHLARGAIESRKTVPPKRDSNYFNVFAGLLRCGHCGAPIQRKVETRGWSRAQLVCTAKLAGVTNCKTASALKTDSPLIHHIFATAGAALGTPELTKKAHDELLLAEAKLTDVDAKFKKAAKAAEVLGDEPEFMANVLKLKQEREGLKALIAQNREVLAMKPGSMFDTKYAKEVIDVLYEVSNAAMLKRADCNARLRRAVRVIWLWAYDIAIVEFKQKWTPPVSKKPKNARQRARDAEDSKKYMTIIVNLDPKGAGDDKPAWRASQTGELKVPALDNAQ